MFQELKKIVKDNVDFNSDTIKRLMGMIKSESKDLLANLDKWEYSKYPILIYFVLMKPDHGWNNKPEQANHSFRHNNNVLHFDLFQLQMRLMK